MMENRLANGLVIYLIVPKLAVLDNIADMEQQVISLIIKFMSIVLIWATTIRWDYS